MQYLIDFAAEDGEFRDISARASEFDTVQGVVLDVDRTWLRCWMMRQTLGDEAADDWFQRELERYHGHRPWWWDSTRWPIEPPFVFPAPLTLSDLEDWKPRHWEHRPRFGPGTKDGPPIIVKVCLRPAVSPKEPLPTPEQLRREGGRLQVMVEARSRAQLSSDPRAVQWPLPGGVSIGVGATDYGTLGVILKDGAGTLYGLTCSHVASGSTQVLQPSRRDSSKAAAIGAVAASTILTSCPAGTTCNPYSGVVANEVDASLIKLSGRPSAVLEVLDIGPLSGVASRASISSGQAVDVMARTSRRNQLETGALAAWYTFTLSGADYCFKNLFEVQSPYGKAGVIQKGDSGAPVCTDDAHGVAWAGQIVGRDAFKGYAMYAQTVQSWIQSKGYSLTVL